MVRPAGRGRRLAHRRRPLDRDQRHAAGLSADAGRARGARAPADGRPGVRRAHARRGSPAAGHRLRAAGRRARVPAVRRSRALPGRFPRRGPPITRGAWPTGWPTRRPRCSASSSCPTSSAPAAGSSPAPLRQTGGMNRPLRIALIVLGAVAFLAVSGVLARYLTTDNAERDADLNLLKAEAAGSAPIAHRPDQGVRGPSGLRDARARPMRARLRRPGAVKILNLQSATANAPTTQTGETRIAWTVIGTPARWCSASSCTAPAMLSRACRLPCSVSALRSTTARTAEYRCWRRAPARRRTPLADDSLRTLLRPAAALVALLALLGGGLAVASGSAGAHAARAPGTRGGQWSRRCPRRAGARCRPGRPVRRARAPRPGTP